MHHATVENGKNKDYTSLSAAPNMSLPIVEPLPDVVNRFWKRVAEVTARYHGMERKWIGGDELKAWTETHTTPCKKCIGGKTKRQCIIDEDHPSCRTCRSAKIGCDRKPQFVFDMTKDQFFPTYDQFLRVYQNRVPGRLRRFRLLNSAIKKDETAAPQTSGNTGHPNNSRHQLAYDCNYQDLRDEIQALKIKCRDTDMFHASNYYRIAVHLQNVDKLARSIASKACAELSAEDVIDCVQRVNNEIDLAYSLVQTKHVYVAD